MPLVRSERGRWRRGGGEYLQGLSAAKTETSNKNHTQFINKHQFAFTMLFAITVNSVGIYASQ